MKNHPFVDRNKRVGAAAADMFLDLNGFELPCDEPAYSELAVAGGEVDKEAIAASAGRCDHCDSSRR